MGCKCNNTPNQEQHNELNSSLKDLNNEKGKKLASNEITEGQKDIVEQIKRFIKSTHEKIKANFSRNNLQNNLRFNKNVVTYEEQQPIQRAENEIRASKEKMNVHRSNANNDEDEEDNYDEGNEEEAKDGEEQDEKNSYANLIQLPGIVNQSNSFFANEVNKSGEQQGSMKSSNDKLPEIGAV